MTTASSYADAYRDWMRDPSAYWESEARGITWTQPWDKVFEPSLGAFGHATSLFLAITFALCVGFDLLFPTHAMYQAWQRLLPGFTWISWSSFCLGLQAVAPAGSARTCA